MKRITLIETVDVITIEDGLGERSLTRDQATELEQVIATKGYKINNFLWGASSLRIINYVGYIACSTFSLEILPKVLPHENLTETRKALMRMLVETGELELDVSDLEQFEMIDEPMHELYGGLFAKKLLREIERGPLLRYTNVEENLTTLKGSLLVSKQLTVNHATNKRYMAYCSYEERMIDHPLNQVLLAAVRKLKRFINHHDTKRRLLHAEDFFHQVTLRGFSSRELERINPDRTEKRYENVLVLAKQILSDESAYTSGEGRESFSVLFEMNNLFESYITSLLVNHTDYDVLSDERHLLRRESGRGVLSLKPDMVVDLGMNKVIIDTKWKILKNGETRFGVKRDDIHQMYAYLSRYVEVQSVVLLYPKTFVADGATSSRIERWLHHENDDEKIEVREISLVDKDTTIKELGIILGEVQV